MRHIDTIVFDLNGTLYERGVLVPGAAETVKALRKAGFNLNFITNTDGRCISDVHSRVVQMGLDVREEELLTPVSAVKHFISANPERTYYPLVHREVLADLSHGKICDQTPDFVVIGDFRDRMDYEEINKVFRMIVKGAEILAMSKTLWYIDRDGRSINSGSFVRMFEEACDKEAVLMGKPSARYFKSALARTQSSPASTLIVGDDPRTDVWGAKNIGATAVQVKTGVYDPDYKPVDHYAADHIIDDVNGLLDLLDL